MRKNRKAVKQNAAVMAIIIFVILTIYVISKTSMYVWGFFTSLKSNYELHKSMISFPKGWPWEWAWGNYVTAFTSIKVDVNLPGGGVGSAYFDTMLLNSLLYTVGGSMICSLTTWLVAYMMVKFNNIKLNSILYTINIMLMTIPVYGTLPAALKIFKTFGWYNNYSFIIFNNLAFTGTNLMYFHAFINGLGREFYEAAYVDGAGNFCIMTRITFPLTQSMFWVFFLTGAITRWNDYMTMVIWMPDYPTLAYGLFKASISSATELSFPPTQIAICMTLMLPMMVLFFMFQEQMLGNLRVGAIKG